MLKLLSGAFSTLEQTLLNDVRAFRRADPLGPALIVSPSGHILTRLQSELAAREAGLLNIECLTFYALAERVMADAPQRETIVTDPAFYQEAIRQVLTGDRPEAVDLEIRRAFPTPAGAVPRGLSAALAATLKDLRDSGLRADLGLQAARDGFLGEQAQDAAPVLALYARLVGLFETCQLRTSADLLRRAAAEAGRHPFLSAQKAIFLYGFYDLTGVQLDLVLSLAALENVRLYFPCEKGNPAYAYAEKLLTDPALTTKTTERIALDDQRARPAPEIWSVSGTRDEVWLAAKEILRLVDDGVAFSEIAVISRHLPSYLPALRELFGTHDIPYVCTRAESAGCHPLIKIVQTLLRIDEAHPDKRTRRKDLEKSPYFKPGTPITPSGEWPPEPASWTAHVARATAWIQQTIALPRDAESEESRLLEAVMESLQALAALDRLDYGPVRWTRFREAWEEKLEGLERPTSPSHTGVQVLEVQQARGMSFKAVFLLGMNEKSFPRLIREDPFLSDAARSALAQATGCRLGRKLDGYDEERLLFELMRQTASERLYLLTQRSNEEGKTMIPSVYLREMQRADPALTLQRLPRARTEKFKHRSPLDWTPKELSFFINRFPTGDPGVFYRAIGWDLREFRRVLTAHGGRETFRKGLGPYDALITDREALRVSLKRGFSPSSLEEIAECPFQYYASHILRLTPPEELAAEGELTDRALGQLFHRTLELFYTRCSQTGAVPGAGQPLERQLAEALTACFEEHSAALADVYPAIIKSHKLFIYQHLLEFIKSDLLEAIETGFRPTWFEQPMAGSIAQLGTTHLFQGKPDRLDMRESEGITEIRVVDYKSGKPRVSAGRVETAVVRGKFLQLPVYLGLAAEFAEKMLGRPAKAVEAVLRPIRQSSENAEQRLSAVFWDSPSAGLLKENIQEMIGIIENGRFYIEPSIGGKWGYCARCDFSRICRKAHMPTRRRAERDAERTRIHGLLQRSATSKAPVADEPAVSRPAPRRKKPVS